MNKCVNCGIELIPQENQNYVFCPKCGTKNDIQESKSEIDENKSTEVNAEQDKIRDIKQKTSEEDKKTDSNNELKIGIIAFVIKYLRFIIAGAILVITIPILLIYAFSGPKHIKPAETVVESDDIIIDFSYSDVHYKNYKDVKTRFESLGFTDIELSTEKRSWLDIVLGDEAEKTSSITINGSNEFKKGDSFPKDAKIHIIYYE